MKIYFVRHGQTNWNKIGKIQGALDIPLNQTGIEEANKLGKFLFNNEEIKPNYLYTSPLKRAKKTAKIISSYINIPIKIENGFKEIDLGDWDGMSWEVIKREQKEYYHQWLNDIGNVCTPNGENYFEAGRRGIDTLKKILKDKDDNSEVMIVSHSGMIKTILCLFSGVPFIKRRMYEMGNCGIVVFNYDKKTESGIVEKIIKTSKL